MMDLDDLRTAINRGAVITYAGSLVGKLIVLGNTILLARLLAPEHFGLVALGLLVLSVSEAVTEAGPAAAIVWRSDASEETSAVALALSLLGAGLIAFVVVLTAPTLAQLFGEPDAAGVISAFALSILLSSPAAVFAGILQRRMAFGRRIVPEIARAVMKGAVGIPMAMAGFGVWSLVVAHISAVAVGLALTVWLAGWRPRLSLNTVIVRELLPYTLKIAAVGLLGVAMKKLDVVIIAMRFDATDLGYYTVAFTLVELAVMGICWSMSQSLFPALSAAGRTPERLQQALEGGMRALFIVTIPIAIGMAVLAEPFMLMVYGEKWAPAIPLVQILAFYGLIYALSFNLGDVYKATGRPGLLVWIGFANLLLAMPILIVGSHWGLVGVAAGQVVLAVLMSAIGWAVACRVTGIRINVLWNALWRPLFAATGAAAACLFVDGMATNGTAPPLRLFELGLLGLAVYCMLLLLVSTGLRDQIRARIRLRSGGSK